MINDDGQSCRQKGFWLLLEAAVARDKAWVMVAFEPRKGLFLSIGCNRKLQSDSRAEAHPIDARTSIGWKLSCQSDAPSPFNPLRFRVSIH